ncbi:MULTISPECIES: hypothetical protein [Paenibacillus]|uniref:hypothetical protein n=1 Tax=Paenibacillus TaxID=44249 RepID=UPI0022B85852|nr:hypothetical protein [Paenibacillus caseinilyticus]MCZ8519740.1 hypothetical protein [Paenibacillus caseinilyticus]
MSYPKQTIMSGTARDPRPHSGRPSHYHGGGYPGLQRAQTRSFLQGTAPGGDFTGGGVPFGGGGIDYPGLGGQVPATQALVPQGGDGGGGLAGLLGGGGGGQGAGGGGGALAGLLGGGTGGKGFNIGQIKQIVDRLGGVEGIVNTFGKMQSVVQSVSQMAPMIKLLLGSFGKGKKGGDDAGDGLAPVRRKRRKRKGPVRGRRRKGGKR